MLQKLVAKVINYFHSLIYTETLVFSCMARTIRSIVTGESCEMSIAGTSHDALSVSCMVSDRELNKLDQHRATVRDARESFYISLLASLNIVHHLLLCPASQVIH